MKLESCCAQFYRHEIDNKMNIGDRFIRTIYLSKNSHLQCLMYSRGLYGKLGWGFVKKNDVYFSIRLDDYKIKAMIS